jgi:hypothetical protein
MLGKAQGIPIDLNWRSIAYFLLQIPMEKTGIYSLKPTTEPSSLPEYTEI